MEGTAKNIASTMKNSTETKFSLEHILFEKYSTTFVTSSII